MRWALSSVAAALAFGLLPGPVLAQSSTNGLAGLLLRFFSEQNPVVLAANPNPAFSHAAHFSSQQNARDTLRQLNRGLATQLSTFPVGSSAGGFSYTFDESLGVYERTTESFGPVFAERPLTAGKGKFSFAVNYQSATWDDFEGQNLKDGDIALYLVHEDTNRDGDFLNLWFEGDVIRADLSLDLQTDTTVFFANYGLGKRLDVGLAVPLQRVSMRAGIATRVEALATSADATVVHQFEGGSLQRNYVERGEASGLGDILLRTKWNFYRGASAALAAGADLRLPTGAEEDLLGSGATQAKLYAVVGGARGRVSPRASFGYTLSSGGSDYTGDLPDELSYSAGVDVAAHRRLTLAADYVGRTLLDSERMVLAPRTFRFTQRADPGNVRTASFLTPTSETGDLHLHLASVGFKVNPVGRLLLVGNVLFALGNSGLQDRVTPVFGVDYSF